MRSTDLANPSNYSHVRNIADRLMPKKGVLSH
jgi:hypothetical protein